MPRPRASTQAEIASPQVATTIALATTIVRRGVGLREQAADGAVGELAAEDPRRQEREQDRAADGDRLPEQVEERRPVGRSGGELRLGAEQPERPGAPRGP